MAVLVFPRAAAPAPRLFEDPRWAERHQPEAASAAPGPATEGDPDCICTAGAVCRHNNACPRRAMAARPALALVGG